VGEGDIIRYGHFINYQTRKRAGCIPTEWGAAGRGILGGCTELQEKRRTQIGEAGTMLWGGGSRWFPYKEGKKTEYWKAGGKKVLS